MHDITVHPADMESIKFRRSSMESGKKLFGDAGDISKTWDGTALIILYKTTYYTLVLITRQTPT